MGNTQVLCFLVLFDEVVYPDKELRRYQGLDFVKGVKGASGAPSVWHRGLCSDAICIIPPQFENAYWWSECVLVVRTETQQLPLAFAC
jgi:hypothetical protein